MDSGHIDDEFNFFGSAAAASTFDTPAVKEESLFENPFDRYPNGGSEEFYSYDGYSNNTSNNKVSLSKGGAGNSRGQRKKNDDHRYSSRPDITEEMLMELNEIGDLEQDPNLAGHLCEYSEGITFPLGEGGRELLRACLNVRGCKGRLLQGASVPQLLHLAFEWHMWNIALRIRVERHTGELSPIHDAFVRFKASQSQMRKYVRKEYMATERDSSKKITSIQFDDQKKVALGKEGRDQLRSHLRKLHDRHAKKMEEMLAEHGYKYAELRNATVDDLSRMAYICNIWDQVVAACRAREEALLRKKMEKSNSEWSDRDTESYAQNPSNEGDNQSPMRHHQDPTNSTDAPWNVKTEAIADDFSMLPMEFGDSFDRQDTNYDFQKLGVSNVGTEESDLVNGGSTPNTNDDLSDHRFHVEQNNAMVDAWTEFNATGFVGFGEDALDQAQNYEGDIFNRGQY